jgi:tripartite-type tricarboxylate transporter receptor subunit TctC
MRLARFLGISIMVLGLILSVIGESPAAGTKFPTRPIQVIITFAPGATDLLLRPFVEKMPEYLGQPVTLVYKPGAGGSLGAAFVADSKPDGYTLVGSSPSAILVLPLTKKDLSYTLQSFTPICCLCADALVFAVQSSAPWKTIKDLVEDAKKSPGQISYSSSGTFAIPHLGFEAFSREAGIKLNYIPSQGGGPAVTALLGGHVQAYSGPIAPPLPHITAGTLRALAVSGAKRIKALPDVPTLTELGYPLTISVGYGLLSPKGAPKEVVETIYLAAKKVVENNEASIAQRLDGLGAWIDFEGPKEYTTQLSKQNEMFSRILKIVSH